MGVNDKSHFTRLQFHYLIHFRLVIREKRASPSLAHHLLFFSMAESFTTCQLFRNPRPDSFTVCHISFYKRARDNKIPPFSLMPFSYCSTTFLIFFNMWATSLVGTLLALATVICAISNTSASSLTVRVKNGTYQGVHSSQYDQDFFLGVPYAQPPIRNLRFQQAQSLNKTWSETRSAATYRPLCVGYGVR